MEFHRTTLETCETATGLVVVIDVLRAFSTAAYAFAAGAQTIALVGSVDEAFSLKKQNPDALLMGELDGLPIPGFDFSNSPTSFDHLDLTHKFMIQRTSAGTQGVVRSRNASQTFACSFCCVSATAGFIIKHSPDRVTFVITGQNNFEGKGDEDEACADYLQDLLRGETPEPTPYLQRVVDSPAGRLFSDPARPEFPAMDLEYCLRVDRFDFAMHVQPLNGLLLMEKVN
jgi:2-phosphosulfolactate phosphatase